MTDTRVPKSRIEKYYELRSTSNGLDLVNGPALQSNERWLSPEPAWPDGVGALSRGPWNLPEYLEPPHAVLTQRKWPDCSFISPYLFVSTRFKALIEEIVPGHCEYRPCVTSDKNGKSGPDYWVFSVVTVFKGAVDLEKTEITNFKTDTFFFKSWDSEIFFSKRVINGCHLFRISEYSSPVFCSKTFSDACRSAKISGIRFEQRCFEI